MEENKRMKPGVKTDWSSLKLQGAAHLSGRERCCGIKDAEYEGEQLEGKRRKRRTDMMEYSR